MRLIGWDVLARSLRKHPDARNWINAWAATVEDADWTSLADLRADFPSADGVKLKDDVVVTVFNVRGNTYRLLTIIGYASAAVRILELLTHAEYDKEQWKERY